MSEFFFEANEVAKRLAARVDRESAVHGRRSWRRQQQQLGDNIGDIEEHVVRDEVQQWCYSAQSILE